MPSQLSTAPASQRLAELRARHPRLVYRAFEGSTQGPDSIRVRFDFRLEPGIEFSPETVIEGVSKEPLRTMPTPVLENLFFHLGLVESFSYWKAACSPEIEIQAEALDDQQVAWWEALLRRGMGEYFYVNQIDWRAPDFVRVVPKSSGRGAKRKLRPASELAEPLAPVRGSDAARRDLVLTSGGKDSVVTLETLRAAGQPFDCLLLNPTKAALEVARQAGCETPIIVRRTIDPRLLELNAAGYLNGHTPFSALLAFLGVTVAALFGYRRVIVSNERSAEEATVDYLGEPINHQYSKTLHFERAFRAYCARYLTPAAPSIGHPEAVTPHLSGHPERSAALEDGHPERSEGSAFPPVENANSAVEYFSLLRPLYELQIAQLFAKYPQYFPLFRSCNRGQATNSWCGRCPKCLFVYTALYPFVEREQILAIFSSPERDADLFAWEGAADVLRALLGLDAAKPFECVGTREETLAALHLCVEKYRAQGLALPPSLHAIHETVLSSRPDLPHVAQRILTSWTDDHHIPPTLARHLRVAAFQDSE